MKTIQQKMAAIAILFALLGTTGCSSQPSKVIPDKWEYKILSVAASSLGSGARTGVDAGKYATVAPSTQEFNNLGAKGWELSGSYLEMETAWVNFGRSDYVTGLQPNIRPQSVVFIFKRKLLPNG